MKEPVQQLLTFQPQSSGAAAYCLMISFQNQDQKVLVEVPALGSQEGLQEVSALDGQPVEAISSSCPP